MDDHGGARANQILEDAGAILHGDHFVYITGDHGDGWIDKDAIFPHSEFASELCGMLADATRHLGVDYVCGPATGGLIVAQWTAYHLGVASLFAEHDKRIHHSSDDPLAAPFVLARGYDRLVDGARVLVVDDVVNTGHSIRQTAAAVAAAVARWWRWQPCAPAAARRPRVSMATTSSTSPRS